MLNQSPSPSSRVCMSWVPSLQFNECLYAESCNMSLSTSLPWHYSHCFSPPRIYDVSACYLQSDGYWLTWQRLAGVHCGGTSPVLSRGRVHREVSSLCWGPGQSRVYRAILNRPKHLYLMPFFLKRSQTFPFYKCLKSKWHWSKLF